MLITGGSGLLAVNWAISVRDEYDVTLLLHHRKIAVQGVNTSAASLDSLDECLAAVDKHQPDIVIHTVGLTNVDECESNIELARELNINIVKNISIACNQKKIKLVHISTDHLFSGEQRLLTEEAIPNPVNNYAKTKLEGEQEVQKNCKDALIIRTNFFGWGTSYRQSFSDFIINKLKNNEPIDLFFDVFFTPILIDELAKRVCRLIDENHKGIFNVVGGERLSKYEFGIKLANCFVLNTGLINKVSITQRIGLVKRPSDMSLSNKKVCKILNCIMPSIDAQFQILKQSKATKLLIEC
jgi:dTDP-4-dehydrorhamnose reductase